jgi:hypothetical protein
MEYFIKHPNNEIPHGPVVDYVENEYLKLYNRKPRDTWREIRLLHQEGILIKVKKVFISMIQKLSLKENYTFSLRM